MINIYSCNFKTENDYKINLKRLIKKVDNIPENSIIVAPEVCLTGFDYDNFQKVAEFALYANNELKKSSYGKIIILTIIEKRDGEFFNFVKIFYNGEIVYERAKARLFRFGGEDKYFSEGKSKDVNIVTVDGIKIGLLVCFELRFKDLWKKLEGADVIAVPAWWGVLRTEHFKTLTKALAIMNECYVIATDSANSECSKISAVINPYGEVTYNRNSSCLAVLYDKKIIKSMRRYMDIGIK